MPLQVDRDRVLAFRARTQHLGERLPPDGLARAAYAGLQDSSPRAAQLSLNARVEDVGPSSWEDPTLVQIWGPRGADYVVPRDDVAVFTLGRLPRDPDQQRGLEEVADDVHGVLRGERMTTRAIGEALPQYADQGSGLIRLAAVTGRLHIRWDASRIVVIPVDRPDADPEEARIELARRFVRWFGPIDLDRFAWWSGMDPDDAEVSWQALDGELVPVELQGHDRFIHADAEQALTKAGPVEGVRLLHPEDTYLRLDRDLLLPNAERRVQLFPAPGRSTGFGANAIVLDGEIVGRFARQQANVTLEPWPELTAAEASAVTAEAEGIARALGRPSRVRWTEPS